MSDTIPIEIPYNLKADELIIDPAAEKSNFDDCLSFISEQDARPEDYERIMRAMVLLKARNPEASLGSCLETALIWEVG